MNRTSTRYLAWKMLRIREYKRRNALKPQDYRRDEQVVIFEISPSEAVKRFEMLKARHRGDSDANRICNL